MPTLRAFLIPFAILILTSALRAEPPPPAAPALTITIDSTQAPDLQPWGEKAKTICEQWYPFICKELASDGFTPPNAVTFKFQKEMGPPAATGGTTISINAPYVHQHMDDLGMMVHELTHVVQSYGRTKGRGGPGMGWMTEGIADYIRWHRYEPGMDHSRINPKSATYHDSYRTTARFLAYLTDKYDKQLVTKLNAQMRAGECSPGSFKDILNRDVDDLWSEFITTLDPKSPAPKPAADPSAAPQLAFSIYYDGNGGGPKAPYGFVEACWDDGLVIFAIDPKKPGREMQTGHITPAQVTSALSEMSAAGIFDLTYKAPQMPDHSTFRFRATRGEKSVNLQWDEALSRPWGAHIGADPAYQRFAKTWTTARTIAAFTLPTDYTPLDKDPEAQKRFKKLNENPLGR